MEILMKLSISALVIGMQTTALGSNNYEDLVAEGYRWAKIDGPYACPTKEDLREITSDPSVIKKVHIIEQIRAYFLIQGALVKVIKRASPSLIKATKRALPMNITEARNK